MEPVIVGAVVTVAVSVVNAVVKIAQRRFNVSVEDALLLQLPAKQRAAMAWHLDGFTTEESARAMGTTQAVRQNLARARAALKEGLRLEGRYVNERGKA
ncbi:sigma-70 region 4 domain-containing protein [Streptomyces sp. NPDC048256]|uniref:sigma-70 region 4 domain-containing protein n=1 Tax=unclassified Streptomyces TaxID=2593676 RepID=UPI0033FF7DE8